MQTVGPDEMGTLGGWLAMCFLAAMVLYFLGVVCQSSVGDLRSVLRVPRFLLITTDMQNNSVVHVLFLFAIIYSLVYFIQCNHPIFPDTSVTPPPIYKKPVSYKRRSRNLPKNFIKILTNGFQI